MTEPTEAGRRGLIALLAVAAGATAANLYYAQPLLDRIAHHLHVSAGVASAVVTATQIGYALGLLLVVPLGDIRERRGLILISTWAIVAMLLLVAASPGAPWMIGASLLLGIATVVPQLVIPYAAGLSEDPLRRNQTVGIVMSGLLVGILISRTVSGLIGSVLGWRATYLVAAVAMVALAIALKLALPPQPASSKLRYAELLASMKGLLGEEPVLRRHALVGGFGFAAFSVFWTTLAFHLETRPLHYGAEVAGLFGLFGVAGALVAPLVGRFGGQRDPRFVNGLALVLIALAFGVFALWPNSLVGMAVGCVLLDAGVQGSHVSNQTRVFALRLERRNRLNAIYMVGYFVGGALGSLGGALAWQWGGWGWVCAVGALCALLAIAALFTVGYRARSWRTSEGSTSSPS